MTTNLQLSISAIKLILSLNKSLFLLASDWFSIWLLAGLLVLSGCDRASNASSSGGTGAVPNAQPKTFQVKGQVIAVKPKEKSIEIKHEEIPGYMPAMTMPFDVRDTNELAGLQPGDSVTFRMLVTDTVGWIDQIHKHASAPATNTLPGGAALRIVREVEPLAVGDALPHYHFTNQFGHRISTAEFKGNAVAITFLFTRCPFPNFCPLMATHFAEVQQIMLGMSNAPTNWQLLTISFDPDFDKPAVLKSYAERYKYEPSHSTFATGALIDITALAEQVGLTFWHDETGNISHNLRTVVVDAAGRVRKIYTGNQWNSSELVQELVSAASPANK